MPSPPDKPAPPVLFGATPQDREASRRSDSLRLDWTPVAGATHHDIRFGDSDIRPDVPRGAFLGSLGPDVAYAVTVAHRNDGGDSPWSDPLHTATRPATPSAPTLASAADARGSSALILTWPPAAGAATYNLRVDGVESTDSLTPPFTLSAAPSGSPLALNREYRVAVRARDDAVGGTSDWSPEVAFVTRPPTPGSPLRVAFDLFLYGLVLQWDVSSLFDGGAQSYVLLWRDTRGAGRDLLLDGSAEPGGHRTGRFVDLRYTPEVAKRYFLQFVVPRAAVPDDLLGADNVSFEGPAIELYRPIAVKLLRPSGPPVPIDPGPTAPNTGLPRWLR